MHYRLGFKSKLEQASLYIECSDRESGINFQVRETLGKQAVIGARSAGSLFLQHLNDRPKFDAKLDCFKKCGGFQYDLTKIKRYLVLIRVLNPAYKRRSALEGNR